MGNVSRNLYWAGNVSKLSHSLDIPGLAGHGLQVHQIFLSKSKKLPWVASNCHFGSVRVTKDRTHNTCQAVGF